MKFEIGKTYKVNHCRKGNFTLHVTEQDDTWTVGTIIAGMTSTLLPENQKFEGEELTSRTSFLTIIEEIKS